MHYHSLGQVKFIGQVHHGHLLVPGQVDNFAIFTSLEYLQHMFKVRNKKINF